MTLVDARGNERELELLPPAGACTPPAWSRHQGVLHSSAPPGAGTALSFAQALGGFLAMPRRPSSDQRYSGRGLLEQIAAQTGGRVLSEPQEVFNVKAAPPPQVHRHYLVAGAGRHRPVAGG